MKEKKNKMRNYDFKKYCLLANFTRSYDQTQSQEGYIHLLGSIFYTTELKYSELEDYYPKLNIIRLYLETDLEGGIENSRINVQRLSNTIMECRMGIIYFLHLKAYGSSKPVSAERLDHSTFFEYIFGNQLSSKKNTQIENLSTNTLFVFEDLDWFTIQIIFRAAGIKLSGGSITKRHILSTSQFNLSKILLSSGYSLEELYLSYALMQKIAREVNYDLVEEQLYDISKFNTERMTKLIETNLQLAEDKTKKIILEKQNSIKKYEQQLSLDENIARNHRRIPKLHEEISKLETKIDAINQVRNVLKTANYDVIKKYYLEFYHNYEYGMDLHKFDRFINRFVKNDNKRTKVSNFRVNTPRYYSTLAKKTNINSLNFNEGNLNLVKNIVVENFENLKIKGLSKVNSISFYYKNTNIETYNKYLNELSNSVELNIEAN